MNTKHQIMILCLLISNAANSRDIPKAVVGTDERIASHSRRDGRLSADPDGGGGCSGSLIGKTCMVSAGHCVSTLHWAEFNTPDAREGRAPRTSSFLDFYAVDRQSIVSADVGLTDEDWAVFRLKKHRKLNWAQKLYFRMTKQTEKIRDYLIHPSGYYPGHIYGHYQVSFERLEAGLPIIITCFGSDKQDRYKDKTQQTATGRVLKTSAYYSDKIFFHDVDTTPGNSGSGVRRFDNDQIIGVHTHSLCGTDKSKCTNGGTSINQSPAFARAIQDCLDWEARNL